MLNQSYCHFNDTYNYNYFELFPFCLFPVRTVSMTRSTPRATNPRRRSNRRSCPSPTGGGNAAATSSQWVWFFCMPCIRSLSLSTIECTYRYEVVIPCNIKIHSWTYTSHDEINNYIRCLFLVFVLKCVLRFLLWYIFKSSILFLPWNNS